MNVEREHIKQLFGEIEELEKENEELKTKLEDTTNIDSLTDEKNRLYAEKEALELKNKELKEFHEDKNEYIEKLEQENEQLEKNCQEKESEYLKLAEEKSDEVETYEVEKKLLLNQNKELEDKVDELEKDLKKVKENMKKPVKINNNSMEIFEELKQGNIITFIQPENNKKIKNFRKNPFVFELDNKGAIYNGQLIGMYERTDNCTKYYHENKAPKELTPEIFYNIMGASPNAFSCKLKYHKVGRGKHVENMHHHEILKLNPCINNKLGLFESYGNYKFIYEENDGSRFIIKNGEKEYM